MGTPVPADENDIREAVKCEFDEYDRYRRGEVFGYTVEAPDGEEDWCWGFIGHDYVLEEAKAAATGSVRTRSRRRGGWRGARGADRVMPKGDFRPQSLRRPQKHAHWHNHLSVLEEAERAMRSSRASSGMQSEAPAGSARRRTKISPTPKPSSASHPADAGGRAACDTCGRDPREHQEQRFTATSLRRSANGRQRRRQGMFGLEIAGVTVDSR